MRMCPHCNVPLTEVDYSGFKVLYCGDCKGHLVDITRLETIKRSARKPPTDLKAEASEEYRTEPLAQIRCPKCHLTMEKRPIRLPGLTLHLDLCKACALIWLDGGELALLQLDYRTTPAYRDTQDLKQRMAELESDTKRKAAFEHDVAKLPNMPGPIEEAFSNDRDDWLTESSLETILRLLMR